MRLHFEGPFQWMTADPGRSVFEAPQAGSPGVYLWTSRRADGYLVSYVGEAGRDFRTRTYEHLREQLAGVYTIRDPEAFCADSKALLWRGLLGRSAEPAGLLEYVRRLPDLVPALVGFIHAVHFHLALTDCAGRMRRRVEAALAASLRALGGQMAAFQDEGARYDARLPHEEPVVVSCSAAVVIHGLPAQLEA